MKALTPEPTWPSPPDAEDGTDLPPADGFEGLSAGERARRAEVLHRAYSIWESKGRPADSQLADWLEAEDEVRQERLAGQDS